MKFFLLLFCYVFSLFGQNVIEPIPLDIYYDKQKAALGKQLFFDPILSKDSTIACVSCHQLPGNGADSQDFSTGVNNQKGDINSPTVLNAVFNFVQFYDGRAKDLKEQALGPIENPVEMGSKLEDVIKKLNNTNYKQKFEKIYPDGVNVENLAEVIAEFEKALITPNAPFDKYLRGDENALSEQEKRGYKKFKEMGCASCHNGVLLGGNMYQKLGIFIEYDHFDPTKDNHSLNGRYNVTKRERDKRVFKVPMLRNIALTAPYMHDATAPTLKDVILDMREHQLGVFYEDNEEADIKDLEAFLKSLTGEQPEILRDMM